MRLEDVIERRERHPLVGSHVVARFPSCELVKSLFSLTCLILLFEIQEGIQRYARRVVRELSGERGEFGSTSDKLLTKGINLLLLLFDPVSPEGSAQLILTILARV